MERRRFLARLSTGVATLPFLTGPFPRDSSLNEVSRSISDRLARLAEDLAASTNPETYWQRVREEFQLQAGLVHLNCGSLGATPTLVNDALSNFAQEIEGNPVGKTFGWGGAQMDEVRALAATFIGATPEETALTRNTTEAMNAIATGLSLRAGDQVVTTNHEHGGGMTCWQYLRKHIGIEIVYVELPRTGGNKAEILKRIANKLTERTRVCSFSHIDTITGVVMPIREISGLARQRGILLVCDGAQAPGMIEVDVDSLGVDAYACSSHKWMLGPKGTGLLYIRRSAQDQIQPAFLHSGFASYTASGGTRGVHRILAQGVAIQFQNIVGPEQIEKRGRQLKHFLREQLATVPELELLTPRDESLSGSMLTYALRRGKSSTVRTRLNEEYNIQIKSVQGTYAYCEEEHLQPENYNALRFSTHVFNDESDLTRTAAALRTVLADA